MTHKAVFADEPGRISWQMLLTLVPDPLPWSVGYLHADSGEMATFVARLQPCQLPGRAARQLPDQSTTLWVESSSTGDSRLRGARPKGDIAVFHSITVGRPRSISPIN
jgi:hypothetical protein